MVDSVYSFWFRVRLSFFSMFSARNIAKTIAIAPQIKEISLVSNPTLL